MSTRQYWRVILTGMVVAFAVYAWSTADWDSCADDLDRLRRAARDAADKANDLKSKSEAAESKLDDLKSKADDLKNCRTDPDMYDLMRDQCRSKAYDYQSARSDYDNALSDYHNAVNDLKSELGTLDNRIRSARSSCQYPLGTTASISSFQTQPPGSENQSCALYRSYKGKLPPDILLKTCAQSRSMSAAECKKCLADE